MSESASTVEHVVHHRWRSDGATCQSLYVVVAGPTLRRTAVLMRESLPSAALEVWLQLATARVPRLVASTRHYDSLLGSDFVYDDIRFWLPQCMSEATDFTISDSTIEVRGQLMLPRKGLTSFTTVVDTHSGLVKSSTWASSNSAVWRVFESEGHMLVDGMAMPSMMTVDRPQEGFHSTMTLEYARLTEIPSETFDLDDLPSVARSVSDETNNIPR